MFSKPPTQLITHLKGVQFQENAAIQQIIDQLMKDAKDPYAASLPLMASAVLGDQKRYTAAHALMLENLQALDATPNAFKGWMRSHGFKAWMWGRVLLATYSIQDEKALDTAKSKLAEQLAFKEDDLAFSTWGWGYRAVVDYKTSEPPMMAGATKLTEDYKKTIPKEYKNVAAWVAHVFQAAHAEDQKSYVNSKEQASHTALSNAVWAWMMNLSAAAQAKDEKTYQAIKAQILACTGQASITEALEKSLFKISSSQDYLAWALVKANMAAAQMGDDELHQETHKALPAVLEEAKNTKERAAEYILAALDYQLALLRNKPLVVNPKPKPH